MRPSPPSKWLIYWIVSVGHKMGKRRKSRELALQALFYMDMVGDDSEERLALFLENNDSSVKTLPFFLKLVRGVTGARPQIDAIIERFSSNWKISRMSSVDRNILRIAVYEMLCWEDIPVKVSINEAIDIGKRFGTEESGAFINGILDSIHLATKNEKLEIRVSPPHLNQAPIRDTVCDPPESSPPSNQVDFTPVKGKNGVVKRRSLNHA